MLLIDPIIEWVLAFLGRQSRQVVLLLGLLLVLLLGAIDALKGDEIGLSFFYLLPLGMVAWYAGKWPALIVSVFSAALWLVSDYAENPHFSHPLIPVWNGVMRLGFFLIVQSLLCSLRASLERERALARTDRLTQVANVRAFREYAEHELACAQRYRTPFALAYLDVDNFKLVNDTQGHLEGDRVLRQIAMTMGETTRGSDVVARLGGDEFAVLFPMTTGEQARLAVANLQRSLLTLVQREGWPITFSIGVAVCDTPPTSLEEVLAAADALMYHAKGHGKNQARMGRPGEAITDRKTPPRCEVA